MSVLSRYEEKIVALQNRSRSLKVAAEQEAAYAQGTAVMSAAAYAYGAVERRALAARETVPTVLGLPPLLTWSVGAIIAGRLIGGRAGDIASDAGRGLLAVHAYKLGSTAS